jgi:protein phosphatase
MLAGMAGPSPVAPLSAFAASDAGRVRATNDDAFLIDADVALFAVADGIGAQRTVTW